MGYLFDTDNPFLQRPKPPPPMPREWKPSVDDEDTWIAEGGDLTFEEWSEIKRRPLHEQIRDYVKARFAGPTRGISIILGKEGV